ncbi:MAG: SUMF1/EgtB/PvdO family nonheme iron enzyme [Planctomycetes bacterium]|nr:SUMF1/EgtB/PvdO family nonheme iron enzyme [Planctomycetota bacterium]
MRMPDLEHLSPAALHVLECADGDLRHSTGMRSLANYKALAQLASERMDKPGFREKLDSAREGARLAEKECRAFFEKPLPGNGAVCDIFPAERDAAFEGLARLKAAPLDAVAGAVDLVLDALSSVTAAVQARRSSLRGFIEGQGARLGSLCEPSDVQFVTDVRLVEDSSLFLDESAFSDALTELVHNSLKYAFAEKKGTVRLEASDGNDPNETVIAVSDDGRGVPEEIRERLFERGVSTAGSGEGLSLVRHIVEDVHLGRLSLETGGNGTRWEITLPVRLAREKLAERLPGAAAPRKGKKGRAAGPVRVPKSVLKARAAVLALAAVAAVVVAGLSLMPGRAPEGFTRAPWAGRDLRTGWAKEVIHDTTGMRLVFVSADVFTMGADEGDAAEGPAHEVAITKPFYLGKYEVTQGEYEKVMGEDPSRHKGDALPVENVSFLDCIEFCRKTGTRFPTEAEWEYAASTSVPGAVGADGPVPVPQTSPNKHGVCGMLGNVSEWCSDWYGLYDAGPQVDPRGPQRGTTRIVRGGSFLADSAALRTTQRSFLAPVDRRDYVGLRCVLDLDGNEPLHKLSSPLED